jgi:hypothetical protein
MSNPAFQGPRCAEELQKPAIADFFSPMSKRKKGTLQSNFSSPLQGIKKEEDVQDVKKESDIQVDQQLSPPKKRKVVSGQRNIDTFFSKNSA